MRRTWLTAKLVPPLVAVVLALAIALPAVGAWSAARILDGSGGAKGRLAAPVGPDSAAVRYGGRKHVFYSMRLADGSVLRHGSLGATSRFETLDGLGGTSGRTANDVGTDVSATVYGDAIHVFYRDDTVGDLRHASFDGATWRFQTLDGGSTVDGRVNADVGHRSVAVRYAGALEVFYLLPADAEVRRGTFDGTEWSFSTLDGDVWAGGHTRHRVGYNLQADVWGGSLHVLYYERDPAYGELLGWVRDATLEGETWRYRRAFRVNSISPGKTLALGVVSDAEAYVAYNTTIQGSPRLRWGAWNGTAWTDGGVLLVSDFGDVAAPALFVVAHGVPILAWYDGYTGPAVIFTWSGETVTETYLDLFADPTSAVKVGTGVRIFWSGSDPSGCCDHSLLLQTTGP